MDKKKLENRFRAEIESLPWELIVEEMERSVHLDRAAPDRLVGSYLIGLKTDLFPSRKFYTLFDYQQLAVCPDCLGDGRIVRTDIPAERVARIHRVVRLVGHRLSERYGRFGQSVPAVWRTLSHRLGLLIGSTRPRRCARCDGVGWPEVAVDRLFARLLSDRAEKAGLLIGQPSGEAGLDPAGCYAYRVIYRADLSEERILPVEGGFFLVARRGDRWYRLDYADSLVDLRRIAPSAQIRSVSPDLPPALTGS